MRLKRRTFLQSLLTIFLPLVRAPRVAAAASPAYPGLVYSDSAQTPDLSALADRTTAAGGITYGA